MINITMCAAGIMMDVRPGTSDGFVANKLCEAYYTGITKEELCAIAKLADELFSPPSPRKAEVCPATGLPWDWTRQDRCIVEAHNQRKKYSPQPAGANIEEVESDFDKLKPNFVEVHNQQRREIAKSQAAEEVIEDVVEVVEKELVNDVPLVCTVMDEEAF